MRVTLSPQYLRTLSVGKHIIKVELTYASVEHELIIVSTDNSSSATGESDLPCILSIVIMLLAAYGAIYAFSRKRMMAE